jgi:hypothetical protein
MWPARIWTYGGAAAGFGLLLVGSCGPLIGSTVGVPTAPPTTAMLAPVASPSPAVPTVGTDSSLGYLVGRANIGPLQPVARVDVAPPTPSPAACTARGLAVYALDRGADVVRFAFQPDCGYSVGLPPRSYRVELDRHGIESSKDLPRTVTIIAGQTTQLEVSIDTGIR